MTSARGCRALTLEKLRSLLEYSPETGEFRWLASRYRITAGDVAGSINNRDYRYIKIDGRSYSAHRLAWFYMTGEWPAEEIDHINLIKDDNRWENLREASHSQNSMNRATRRDCAAGAKGVKWDKKSRKWVAEITITGRPIYLGTFGTISEAAAAYAVASEKYHGEFGRTT